MEAAKSWHHAMTEGAGELMAALDDLGEAGKEALQRMGDFIGGQVAQVADYLVNGVNSVVETVKNATNGEINIFGVKVDLNPFW